jgi:hypothetical protein
VLCGSGPLPSPSFDSSPPRPGTHTSSMCMRYSGMKMPWCGTWMEEKYTAAISRRTRRFSCA